MRLRTNSYNLETVNNAATMSDKVSEYNVFKRLKDLLFRNVSGSLKANYMSTPIYLTFILFKTMEYLVLLKVIRINVIRTSRFQDFDDGSFHCQWK